MFGDFLAFRDLLLPGQSISTVCDDDDDDDVVVVVEEL